MEKKTLEEVMAAIKHWTWRYHWCTAGEEPMPENLSPREKYMWRLCACLGCCNRFVKEAGYTKDDWLKWREEHPLDIKDVSLWYGVNSLGNYYTVRIYENYYEIGKHNLDEQKVRQAAKRIVGRFGLKGGLEQIDSLPFQWNGTL